MAETKKNPPGQAGGVGEMECLGRALTNHGSTSAGVNEDEVRELRIADLGVAVEAAYALGHRDEARRLAALMRREVAMRSPAQVRRMEMYRGLIASQAATGA